jgi:PAS domain S-box-containing protein
MRSPRPDRTTREPAETGPEGVGPQTAALVTQDHLAALVSSSDDAILSKDLDGVITSWNPAAARMYGYAPEEAIGRPVSILIPEHRSGEEREILARVLAGERVEHYETERVTKDGRTLNVSLSVSPVRDSDGTVVSAATIARDITAERRSRDLAERLQEVTAALAREITPERAIEALMEETMKALEADAGTVGMLAADGTEVELAGASGHSAAGLVGWDRFPIEADVPMAAAIRTGEAVWTRTAEELRSRYPDLAGAPLRFGSPAVVPLLGEGKPMGAISLSFAVERGFDPQERAFLASVAQHAASALERARLYEAQRLARERLAFLAEASELLAGSLDPDEALRRLADLTVGRIADWCGVELVDEEGDLRNVAVAHADPARVQLAHDLRTRYPVDPQSETGVPNVVRTGEPEIYPEIPDRMLVEAAEDEEHLRLMRELGLLSAMVVPLVARGKVLGALTIVSSREDRRFDEADLELAQDLARRAAMALDNAILFRREHEAAVILQRSLLPQTLPQVEGLEFAARYEPAAPGLEVGGDWYEVVDVGDGTVGVSIGDVAGRGIHAASVMGRVRPALRAYVLDGRGPLEAIRRLDRLIKELGEEQMTTIFHLHLDPATDRAEYVRAGHPPALLRLPGGEVRALGGTGTPPLGILEDADYSVHSLQIPPGSLLLLYTDGLIERRDEPFEKGVDSLKAALARAPEDAEGCLDALMEEFRAAETPDDVAMLAMTRRKGV